MARFRCHVCVHGFESYCLAAAALREQLPSRAEEGPAVPGSSFPVSPWRITQLALFLCPRFRCFSRTLGSIL